MAMDFLRLEMGMKVHETTKAQALITDLSNEEKGLYTQRFQSIDQEKKGFISISDIRRSLRVIEQASIYYASCITSMIVSRFL